MAFAELRNSTEKGFSWDATLKGSEKTNSIILNVIQEFAQMMVSDEAIGSNGYLTKIGAAPMVSELLSRTRSDVDTLAAFDVVACADKKHPLKDAGYAFSGKLCK